MSELLENNTQPFLPPKMLLSHLEWCFIYVPQNTLSLPAYAFFPPSTGRRPDQPGWGLPVRREVDSVVQPPELQILEETEPGAQTSGSHGPHPRAWKRGELDHSFVHPSPIKGSTWSAGRKSLSQSWRWLDIRGGSVCVCMCVSLSHSLSDSVRPHGL